MLSVNLFQAVGALIVNAKARDNAAHSEFLGFYRQLVETLPIEAVRSFGSLSVRAKFNGVMRDWAIELSATDYIWWKQNIDRGARLDAGPAAVQLEMLHRLSKQAEVQNLTPEERKALISLLDAAQVSA